MARPTPAPLPRGLGIEIDRSVRFTDEGHVLIGGTPPCALRLPATGVGSVIRGISGARPTDLDERILARTLVETGLAHPRPAPVSLDERTRIVLIGRGDAIDPAALVTTLDLIAEHHPGARPVVVGATGIAARTARERGARTVDGPTGGPGALAAALAACDGEFLALLEAGSEPSPGWLENALGHFVDPDVAAVVPRTLAARRPLGPTGMTVAALHALRADRGGRSRARPALGARTSRARSPLPSGGARRGRSPGAGPRSGGASRGRPGLFRRGRTRRHRPRMACGGGGVVGALRTPITGPTSDARRHRFLSALTLRPGGRGGNGGTPVRTMGDGPGDVAARVGGAALGDRRETRERPRDRCGRGGAHRPRPGREDRRPAHRSRTSSGRRSDTRGRVRGPRGANDLVAGARGHGGRRGRHGGGRSAEEGARPRGASGRVGVDRAAPRLLAPPSRHGSGGPSGVDGGGGRRGRGVCARYVVGSGPFGFSRPADPPRSIAVVLHVTGIAPGGGGCRGLWGQAGLGESC